MANIIFQYLSSSHIQGYLFNSDALYLPTLFSDIFANGGSTKDWFLTPAPYFFPDYPMFLLAYLVGPTPYSQIIVFALLQIFLTFLAVWLVVRIFAGVNSILTVSTILVILIWLALSAGEPFALLLHSAYHYGAFLSVILLSALWIKFTDEDKSRKKVLFFLLIAVITYATALSDNLLLVHFVAPLIATQVLMSIAERDFSLKNKIPLMLVAICSFLGSISYKWVVENQTRYPTNIGIDKLSSNLKDIFELFQSTIMDNPVYGFIFFLYIGVVLHSFITLIRGEVENFKLSWLAIFSFLSLCATLVAVLLITNLPVTSRYFIPVLSWPVIVVFIFLKIRLQDNFVSIAVVTSLLAILYMTWTSHQLIKQNGFKGEYYPEEISCIDNALEKEDLYNGISQYWDAKYLQTFSRLDLSVAQYFDNLSEMHWITSRKYFKQTYDFAIISEDASPPYKISSEALTRLNGAPQLVKTCGSKLVFIYGKDKMRVRKFVSPGNTYTWKACELPTKIGETVAECEMQKKDNAQSGYVTFGPYERLQTGQYTFEIAYSSTIREGESVGDWDVVLALPKEAKVLKNGLIAGTDGRRGMITGQFTLDSGQNMEKVEIRTLARPNVDLKVTYIRVKWVR
ncbi:hypothetical protein [Microbulbifer variabilis]|uniref:hypothetical protein n=1 Tax=Microbulbifer variabilis TaxID=266805 RepID=UPI001CFF1D8E|nr:hypothetical protein [Microbulbifer variabilis]